MKYKVAENTNPDPYPLDSNPNPPDSNPRPQIPNPPDSNPRPLPPKHTKPQQIPNSPESPNSPKPPTLTLLTPQTQCFRFLIVPCDVPNALVISLKVPCSSLRCF